MDIHPALNGSTIVCPGTNETTLQLADFVGTVLRWEKANDELFSKPNSIAHTDRKLIVSDLTKNTFYRAVVTNGVCDGISDVATIRVDNSDGDGDTVPDCLDICPDGDDRVNSDALGMPDDCDCNPNDPEDEFVRADGIAAIEGLVLPGIYPASFELLSTGKIGAGTAVLFQAGHQITLEPGFHARAGSDFTAAISLCEPASNRDRIAEVTLPTTTTLFAQPNPFQNQLHLSLETTSDGPVSLEIYHSSGQLVQRVYQSDLLPIGSHQRTLSTDDWPTGLYILRLHDLNGVQTQKVLLQR